MSGKTAEGGRLATNIMHFARVLRGAGLPVGSGQVLDAIDAAQMGGLASKDDFYWTLHALFVKRHEQSQVFGEAFHVFWRKPKMIEQLMQLLFHQVARPVDAAKPPARRRVAEALFAPDRPMHAQRQESPGAVDLDVSYSFSSSEILRRKDFEQMTVEELAEARRAIRAMRLAHFAIPTRRFRPQPHGERIDFRRSFRSSLRSGAGLIELRLRQRRWRQPPFVVLCDISGSMAGYSRIFLHFLHAFLNELESVHVFLFGTRLTNVTRELRRRDPDEAVDRISRAVKDWSGGTRIGSCLKMFNFLWGRRVLGQGTHVILITDGLDREDVSVLGEEMARLRRSARRVVWLNPLLRYSGFEARARGVVAMMPHVDEFRPVHNLEALADIAAALTHGDRPEHSPRHWMKAG